MTQQCVSLGITDNLCGQCAPVCDRCDADVGFKLVNPDGLRFGAATFDEKSLAKGSVQARNMCILARYGNGGKVTSVPTAASFAVATTTDAKTRRNWYGGCAAGDTRACCDNGAVLASGFDWSKFALGSTCDGNTDRSKVTVELTCLFDDDIQYSGQAPPDPDPIDYLEIPDVLESDEEPWASKLVNVGGVCQLAIQDTGNLVVSKVAGQAVVWQSGSGSAGGAAPYSLGIFDKGNLVLSDKSGKSIWSTSTANSGALRAILFKDCNFCLVKDYVGKGEWSRGSGQPVVENTPSSCTSLPYPSCRANPSCLYVRKWGCFPKSSKSDGTKQWCRDLGRPRAVCLKNPKCKYDTRLGCYASYLPASSAKRESFPSSLYMMDPADVRPPLHPPPAMSALEASFRVKPAAHYSPELHLDPASELQARRRLLSLDDDGGGDSLSEFDDDDLSDDDFQDILSDSDDDATSHSSARPDASLRFADALAAARRRMRLATESQRQQLRTAAGMMALASDSSPSRSPTDPSGSDYIWCSNPPPTAPPPPPPAAPAAPAPAPVAALVACPKDAEASKLCADGKSLLNIWCQKWRDGRDSFSEDEQRRTLAKCMAQDCEQSIEEANYCRYRDGLQLCYAYDSAQVFCSKQKTANPLCNDGGEDWAVSPVGTAANIEATKWTPRTDAVLAGKGPNAGKTIPCSCLKRCSCSAAACWCRSDADKTAVGGDTYFAAGKFTWGRNNEEKKKSCACTCGGTLGI